MPRRVSNRHALRAQKWTAALAKAALTLIFTGTVLFLAVYYLPMSLNPQGNDAVVIAQQQADLLAARNATRTSLVALVAALGALGTLVFTALTFRLNRGGQIADRYADALDKINSPSCAVRIGGLYVLEQISNESPTEKVAVLDVLTVFVREVGGVKKKSDAVTPAVGAGATRSDDGQGTETLERDEEVPLDLQTALDIIGRRKPYKYEHPIDFRGADLSNADMRSMNLEKASFSNCILNNVYLTGSDLRGASFENAKLAEVFLTDTNLLDASFQGTTFRKVDMTAARIASEEQLSEEQWKHIVGPLR